MPGHDPANFALTVVLGLGACLYLAAGMRLLAVGEGEPPAPQRWRDIVTLVLGPSYVALFWCLLLVLLMAMGLSFLLIALAKILVGLGPYVAPRLHGASITRPRRPGCGRDPANPENSDRRGP